MNSIIPSTATKSTATNANGCDSWHKRCQCVSDSRFRQMFLHPFGTSNMYKKCSRRNTNLLSIIHLATTLFVYIYSLRYDVGPHCHSRRPATMRFIGELVTLWIVTQSLTWRYVTSMSNADPRFPPLFSPWTLFLGMFISSRIRRSPGKSHDQERCHIDKSSWPRPADTQRLQRSSTSIGLYLERR